MMIRVREIDGERYLPMDDLVQKIREVVTGMLEAVEEAEATRVLKGIPTFMEDGGMSFEEAEEATREIVKGARLGVVQAAHYYSTLIALIQEDAVLSAVPDDLSGLLGEDLG